MKNMITKDTLSDTLQAIEEQCYEYYSDGDGTDNYCYCFAEDVGALHYEPERAADWLRAALDADYYDRPHVNNPAVKVYQRWIESAYDKWNDGDAIAEPEFSPNEYWVSRDTLTAYSLPEYDVIDQDTDYSKYPRLSAAINADNACVDVHDTQLFCWLSGNIVYKPTKEHKRAARLIMHLYSDER